MIFSHERLELRKLYFDVWEKHQNKLVMSEMEKQIFRVIEFHPEYHHYLQTRDNLHKDFPPEFGQSNPFLHMGLHLGLIEQIITDRPQGIQSIYQQLLQKFKDEHTLQHEMMDRLAESIYSAQKNHTPPDEQNYLRELQALCNN
ncbi:DUF1841 family protein [Fangia hongkongensis]|uniref:DUF1841 family protein n=1 Tax=Fangia hongkongensis TaxID=270495 RepID=UPI000370344C|nr:DUF1841 family protein [Fangia hongkongensis]MBK2124290.1 DUF1841 family protein [Fangia hongkongensis]